MKILRLITFLAGCSLLALGSLAIVESVRANSWPTVTAEAGPTGYYYRVAGRTYAGWRVTSLDFSALVCPVCKARLPFNRATIVARYDPANASRSLISTATPWASVLAVGLPGAVFLGLAVFWRSFGRMLLRQLAPDKVFNGAAVGVSGPT
jgi:hypothetical protein